MSPQDLQDLMQNKYVFGVLGALAAWWFQLIKNKRGTFSYTQDHRSIGFSEVHPIFGSISIALNGHPISNLHLSTIELVNDSMNDYENVVIRTYTGNTRLLSELCEIVGTPNILEWTEQYRNQLNASDGTALSDQQWALYHGQREYLIPVMNREQTIKLTYLNEATAGTTPAIFLDVTKKGVKLKHRTAQPKIFGVSQPHASIAGLIIGVGIIISLVSLTTNVLAASCFAMIFGLGAQIPGAYAIKLWRKLRTMIGS